MNVKMLDKCKLLIIVLVVRIFCVSLMLVIIINTYYTYVSGIRLVFYVMFMYVYEVSFVLVLVNK